MTPGGAAHIDAGHAAVKINQGNRISEDSIDKHRMAAIHPITFQQVPCTLWPSDTDLGTCLPNDFNLYNARLCKCQDSVRRR